MRVVVGACLLGMGASSALGATLTIQPITGDQIVGRTTNIVVTSTSNGTGGLVGVRYRPASGPPCGASHDADAGQDVGQFAYVDFGPWTYTFPVTWTTAGRTRICIWLDDINDEPTLTATSVEVQVFEEPGTVNISAPARGILGRPVQLQLSGLSPTPRYLFAKVRPNDGRPCAGAFSEDPGTPIVMPSATLTSSGYLATARFVPTIPAASYIACGWLVTTADPTLDPRPAVGQRTFAVGGPLSNLHRTPTLSAPRLSGGVLRAIVRTSERGTLVVRLVGKKRNVLVVRRVFTGARTFSLAYRPPTSLRRGRYLLTARFTTAGRPGSSRPAQKSVLLP